MRRSSNALVGGVCAGIAEQIGWTPKRVRILYVLVSILSAAFPGTLVYLILWIALPPPDDSPPVVFDRSDRID